MAKAKKSTPIAAEVSPKIDIIKTLNEITQELLDLCGVNGNVEITEESNDTGAIYHVVIESTEEAGLLIGAHGLTLAAIQSFLGMALRTRTGDWHRVLVDVSGWRQKHEEYLLSLAKQSADRAKMTGEPQYLYNLTPAQRRIIHTALSEMKDVESVSEGEGADRYLIVKAL